MVPVSGKTTYKETPSSLRLKSTQMPCSPAFTEPARWTCHFPLDSFILSKNCCDMVNSCSSNLLDIYFFSVTKPDLFPASSEHREACHAVSVDLSPQTRCPQEPPSSTHLPRTSVTESDFATCCRLFFLLGPELWKLCKIPAL